MREYETVLIIDPNFKTENVEETITKFTDLLKENKGRLGKIDKWGRRKLAYPISGHSDGFYVVIGFKGGDKTLKEIDRALKLTDEVIRFRIIRRD